jgi:hypothetical protein
MNAECRRTYETGTRVGRFSDAQPDSDAGNQLSAAKVKEMVARMEQVATAQRAGLIDVHAAAMEKRRLRREMLAGPIAHMAEVGAFAAREQHELRSTFRFKPGGDTYVAFRTAAGNMLSEAEAHKEVLAKHGLSESVLALFAELLNQFDAAVALGANGRTTHKGATRQLQVLATELAAVIRMMDARNRQRFQDNPQLLESWISASTVLGAKRGGVSPAEPGASSGTSEAGSGSGERSAA